jgi:catechol 2,3-dioxygenase-like lactoylglutathione lyase family enzyme
MGFAHLTLATRDVAATAEFFSGALGWSAIERPGNIDGRAAWLRMSAGQELHLLEVPEFQPSEFEREFGRHVALNYPLSEFDNLKQRLIERGAELIEPLRPTPFERFFFKDPNGYIFEIVPDGLHAETP